MAQTEKVDETLEAGSNFRKNLPKLIIYFISFIAIAMTLFHLYTAVFGVMTSIRQRSIHVGFAVSLVFLLHTMTKARKTNSKIPIYDWVLFILSIVTFGYIAITADDIAFRMSYISPLSKWQLLAGISAVLLLMETVRRTIGYAFLIIIFLCIGYVYIGPFLPGIISHKGFDTQWFIDHLVFTTNGVFGEPAGVSATYIFIFILFGSFLHVTGAGDRLINLAFSLVGTKHGGPAKAAVVASGFFGMITGSAVANVVTTGTFTIPMIKKTGFPSDYAGGVEAVASSGGQITPPLMGASAFLIAEFLGVPYIEIVAAAVIPAILYYSAILLQIHFRALKNNLTGLSEEETPQKMKSLITAAPYLLSVIAIVYFLMLGYTPLRAGLFAILFILGINILVSFVTKVKAVSVKEVFQALESGAKNAIPVAIICASAGIIIGVISMTGIGLRASSLILTLAGGSLVLTLIITMITSIILGMGMPTVGAYIIQVALTVPALIEIGVPPLAAHMFIFYFSALSAITPPVALASYAAAGIAESDPMKTGITAFKLAMAGFIIPFMFVFGPSLLLMGTPMAIFINAITAFLGVMALAGGIESWFIVKTNIITKSLYLISAILLIYPNFLWSGIGLLLLAALTLYSLMKRREVAIS